MILEYRCIVNCYTYIAQTVIEKSMLHYVYYVARTEIHFIAWHESHTLALSRHADDKAKDNQVCFHGQHFCVLVNPWQSIWCHWGTLIRLHVVLGSCQRPSWPGSYTVAVSVFYWAHNGCFSVPMNGLACLWLPTSPPSAFHLPPLPPSHLPTP